MTRKSLISFLIIFAAAFAGHTAALAQSAPVDGRIMLQKADGTSEPVAGALIEVYRTDIKSGAPSAKTNKKGEFYFAGLLFGGVYAFSISHPSIAPTIFPNVKAGQEKLSITVYPGDGKKYTEAEVRQGVVTAAPAGGEEPQISEAERKAMEEHNKMVEEENAKYKKAVDTNKLVNAVLKEGVAAFQAGNFDLAIAKFDEGYKADPEFAGSAAVMLTNKGAAYRERGITSYLDGSKGDASAKAAGKQKLKTDFDDAMVAFDRALVLLDKSAPSDPAAQAKLTASKLETLKQYVILLGPLAKLMVNPEKTQLAAGILDKYLALETDSQKSVPLVLSWAKDMNEAGETKNAIHAYEYVLQKSSDNLDAMAGIGLAMYIEGVGAGDDAQVQNGLNYMQKFVDAAPSTHPLKASIVESIDDIKKTTKLTPQKTPKKKP